MSPFHSAQVHKDAAIQAGTRADERRAEGDIDGCYLTGD